MSHSNKVYGWLLCVLSLVCVDAARAQVTPVLIAVSPDSGPAQVVSVTLKGTDLVQEGHGTSVDFNGTTVPAQDLLYADPTTLIVLVPAGATSGPVGVSVGGLASNTLEFSVTADAYVPDQVIARFIRGASIGRGLVETNTDLLAILPVERELFHQLEIPDGRSVDTVIRQLFATGLVEDAFANLIDEAFVLPSRQNQNTPKDILFEPRQYGPQRIHAIDENGKTPDAQRLATGRNVTIAVLDTGVDVDHEDLDAKITGSFDATTIPPNPGAAPDQHSHGTHVAGIAAAETDNTDGAGKGVGIAGIAPDADLLNVKVLGPGGPNAGQHVAQKIGLDAVIASGARVVNASLGGGDSPMKREAYFKAVRHGVVVVAAAGNGGDNSIATSDRDCFPAAYSEDQAGDAILAANGIIAVGNSDKEDKIVLGPAGLRDVCNGGGSSNGPHLDVAAPGNAIHSTVPGNAYADKTGTSMAAPHVSGVVAMMLQADPNLTPAQVECLLEITSTDIETPGFDWGAGNGRTAAFAAVHAVMSLAGRYELLPPDCNKPPPARRDPGGGKPPVIIPPPPVPVPVGGPGTPLDLRSVGVFPGIRDLDQVVPVTADSRFAYLSTENVGVVRVDLNDNSTVSFAGAPFSDPVITSNDLFALVLEESADPSLDSDTRVKRFRIGAPGDIESLAIPMAVTELTLTPDSLLALVGTISTLEVIQTDPLAARTALAIESVSGVSVTPDSQLAFTAVATGVERVVLGGPTGTLLDTGLPITGVTITPDGTYALVGTESGISVIQTASGSVSKVAAPTPVSNIAASPDSTKAVYAGLDRVVIVDLATLAVTGVVVPVTITDLDITHDSVWAVVGTVNGISRVQLASPNTHNAIATDTPLLTGLNLSPDGAHAVVGTPGGVDVVDLVLLTATHVALGGDPLTNVSVAPNSVDATVGLDNGVATIDLNAKTAQVFSAPRARIASTIVPDGSRAVYGTDADLRVIAIGAPATVTPVVSDPPRLNDLPDAAQGPNNPSGERGTAVRTEG